MHHSAQLKSFCMRRRPVQSCPPEVTGESSVLPAVRAPLDAALQPRSPQDVGCGVLTEFVWLQVNVGVNVFGRGETGTTTDQVCIEQWLHRIASPLQLDVRALCTRDMSCVHPGVAPVLRSVP